MARNWNEPKKWPEPENPAEPEKSAESKSVFKMLMDFLRCDCRDCPARPFCPSYQAARMRRAPAREVCEEQLSIQNI